ncbi:MAG: acyltransferase [Myxococcota bacterium]|nr:acyltransferase [Myxococcota bacterium]
MKKHLKKLSIKCWPLLSPFIPDCKTKAAIDHKVYMADLYETNIVRWRVEEARSRGVKVGKNCKFFSSNFFSEPFLVEIGDNVIVSGNVMFITHDGTTTLWKDNEADFWATYGKIKIGNNCFIGMGAIISRNVVIGDNCIIGAGAVVRQDVPDNSVVSGNPAKVIFKTSMAKKLILADKNTIKKPFKTREEKNAYVANYFGVNVNDNDPRYREFEDRTNFYEF